jgi:RNase P subunit RPR2
MQSMAVDDISRSFQLFQEGHKLIRSLPDDVHKYRQVELYKEVFERKYALLPKNQKNFFEQACKALLVELRNVIPEAWPGTPPRVITRVFEMLEGILGKINSTKK